MNFDTFFFDLGKVLIDFDQSKLIQNLSNLVGVEAADIQSFLESGIQMQYESGLISTQNLYGKFCELSSSFFTEEQLKQAACDIFTPIQGSVEIVKRLRAMNKRLVIVSNTSEIHKEYCVENFDFISLFDHHIYSFEVLAMKPNPKFYQAAFEVASGPKEKCLFIDDLAANIAGAKKFGFHVHHFRDSDSLGRELFL